MSYVCPQFNRYVYAPASKTAFDRCILCRQNHAKPTVKATPKPTVKATPKPAPKPAPPKLVVVPKPAVKPAAKPAVVPPKPAPPKLVIVPKPAPVVVPPLPPIPELGPIGMAEPGKSLSWSQLEELATDAPAPLVVDEPAEKESLFSKLTGGKKKKKSKKTKKTD